MPAAGRETRSGRARQSRGHIYMCTAHIYIHIYAYIYVSSRRARRPVGRWAASTARPPPGGRRPEGERGEAAAIGIFARHIYIGEVGSGQAAVGRRPASMARPPYIYIKYIYMRGSERQWGRRGGQLRSTSGAPAAGRRWMGAAARAAQRGEGRSKPQAVAAGMGAAAPGGGGPTGEAGDPGRRGSPQPAGGGGAGG